MLIINDLQNGPEEIWLNWKKKLAGIRKVCFIVSIEAILATIKTNKNYEKETIIY